jgi:threonine synthase
MCPEGAACVVALGMERASGRIKADDQVVLFNTASGLKSPMPPLQNRLEPGQAVDYSVL